MDCDEIKENPSADINSLLNSFSSLQTNEKDDLCVAFQNIANELSYTTARFFLEMNNWNLPAAVGCYFDFVASSSNQNASLQPMPSMRIVKELTVGMNEAVTPGTHFTQSWLLENNGTVPWPTGTYLKLVSEINNDGKMFIPSIAPNDTYIVTVELMSPSELGQSKSQFCLCTPMGVTFGPIIWSVVDVSPAGTLALTQQLSQLHTTQPKTCEQLPQQQQMSGCANWTDQLHLQLDPSTTFNCGIEADNISNQSLVPPQNSPNTPTHDEEMMEKINTHNL